MKKTQEGTLYKALVTLWTTDADGKERFMQPGEVSSFSHLTPANLQRLKDKGAIDLYSGEWPLPEEPEAESQAQGFAPLDITPETEAAAREK